MSHTLRHRVRAQQLKSRFQGPVIMYCKTAKPLKKDVVFEYFKGLLILCYVFETKTVHSQQLEEEQ